MIRNISLYLDDILQSIERIEVSTKELTQEEFDENIDIQDATVRRLEIIGESVKHIPQEFKDKHIDIPWRKIAGTRDVVIHDYFEINMNRIWGILQHDLNPLKKQIQVLLQELGGT